VHNHYLQDGLNPAHLGNHNNTDPALMNYADDWYIVSADMGTSPVDPSAYMLIYYCGSNDAWQGFQGSVLYTRTPEYGLSATTTALINQAMVETQVPGFTSVATLCSPSSKVGNSGSQKYMCDTMAVTSR
jgi:violaxanthin de-epoxidase